MNSIEVRPLLGTGALSMAANAVQRKISVYGDVNRGPRVITSRNASYAAEQVDIQKYFDYNHALGWGALQSEEQIEDTVCAGGTLACPCRAIC